MGQDVQQVGSFFAEFQENLNAVESKSSLNLPSKSSKITLDNKQSPNSPERGVEVASNNKPYTPIAHEDSR